MNCIKTRMMPLGFYYWKYITELFNIECSAPDKQGFL